MATDRIELLHPGPVFHVPPRARGARDGYLPTVTTVRLRELSLSDTQEGPLITHASTHGSSVRTATRLVDGAIWRPVGRDDPARAPRGRAAHDLGSFRAWLEGRPGTEPMDLSDVARSFAGTPLVARRDLDGPLARGRSRVAPGTVLVDLRDAASQAVRDLFERDVALVDGVAMVRMPGPVAYGRGGTWRVPRFPGLGTQDPDEWMRVYHRIDRLPAQGESPLYPGTMGYSLAPARVAGVRYRGDEDIRLSLGAALSRLAFYGCGRTWRDPTPDGVALRDRIVAAALAASAWLLRDEELPELADLFEDGCRRQHPEGPDVPEMVRNDLAYLRHHVRPVLEARAPRDRPEDIEALSVLGPGPGA